MDIQLGLSGKWVFRKSLIVFQFAISLILVISSLIISRQLSYMQNKSLGFDQNQVLVLDATLLPERGIVSILSY